MERLEQTLRQMDFRFFGTGQHIVGFATLLADPTTLLVDLRSDDERAAQPVRILGANRTLHIPLDQLPDRWKEIPADPPVGLFCSSDLRSSMAFVYLRALGRDNVSVLKGGYASLADQLRPGMLYKHLREDS